MIRLEAMVSRSTMNDIMFGVDAKPVKVQEKIVCGSEPKGINVLLGADVTHDEALEAARQTQATLTRHQVVEDKTDEIGLFLYFRDQDIGQYPTLNSDVTLIISGHGE